MRRRHPWLLPLLIVLLVAVPIFEVWLLIQVGQAIGVLPTLLILVAEAILGGWLLRREGNRAWKSLTESFRAGRMPAGELTDAALILVGGVFLMLPGFATDVIGLFFLLPFTRPWARKLLGVAIARRTGRAVAHRDPGTVVDGTVVDGTVVDGTVVDESEADGTRREGNDPEHRPIRGSIDPPS